MLRNNEILITQKNFNNDIYIDEIIVIGKKIHQYINENDELYYIFDIITNNDGEDKEVPITAISKSIDVIQPYSLMKKRKYFYTMNEEYENFINRDIANPFTATEVFFGTGLYGYYKILDKSITSSKVTSNKGKYKKLYLKSPYYIQNKKHVEAFIFASYNLNHYVNKLYYILRNNKNIYIRKQKIDVCPFQSIHKVLRLLNFVFYFNNQYLEEEELCEILKNYMFYYFVNNIDIQPINFIFYHLKYDGIIYSDYNKWDRQCIKFI